MKDPLVWVVLAILTVPTLVTSAGAQLSVGAVAPADEVELFVYAGRDATLVRQHVALSLVAGANTVEFAWRELTLDPTSISLRVSDGPEAVATTFPTDRPGTVWFSVEAERGGVYAAQVAYMAMGFASATRYRGVLSEDRANLDLTGYIELTNNGPEAFANAKMSVVAGEVQLLSDVRAMSERSLIPTDAAPDQRAQEEAARVAAEQQKQTAPPPKPPNPWDLPALGGLPQPPQRVAAPKLTPESGVPEYWVYPAEGLRGLAPGETRQFDFLRAQGIPVRSVIRFDPAKFGDRAHRVLILRNDADSGLGQAPIPPGSVWLLEQGGESILPVADAQMKHAAVDEEVEMDTGPELRLVVERKLSTYELTGIETDPSGRVSGYDQHEEYTLRLRNTTDTELAVEVTEEVQGAWDVRTDEVYERAKDNTATLKLTLAPGEEHTLVYRIIKHNGTRVRG